MNSRTKMDFKGFIYLDELDKAIQELDLAEAANPNIYLDPRSGKKWRHANLTDQLRHILNAEKKNGFKASDVWIQFADHPKLGIYPKAPNKNTPLGIYAYPIEYAIQLNAQMPYAGDRPYIIVFKIKDKSKILSVSGKERNKNFAQRKVMRLNLDSDLSHVLEYIKKNKPKFISYIEKLAKISPPSLRDKVDFKLKELLDFVYSHINRSIQTLKSPFEDKHKKLTMIHNVLSQGEYYLHAFIQDINSSSSENIQYAFIKMTGHTLKYRLDLNDEGFTISYDGKYLTDEYKKFKNIYLKKHGYRDPNWNPNPEGKKRPGKDKDATFRKVREDAEEYARTYMGRLQQNEFKNKLPPDLRIVDEEYKKHFFKLVRDNIELKKFLKKSDIIKKIHKFYYQIKSNILDQLEQAGKDKKKNLKLPGGLENLISKYDIDKQDLLSYHGVDKHSNGQQIIYDVTRRMSTIIGGRNTPLNWTKLLRELGFEGMIDHKATGTIYSTEPAQGVFFTVSNLEVITIINNRPNVIGTDKPEDFSWDKDKTKHTFGGPILNPHTGVSSYDNRNRQELTLLALYKKINDINAYPLANDNQYKYTINLLKTCQKAFSQMKFRGDSGKNLKNQVSAGIANCIKRLQHYISSRSLEPPLEKRVADIINIMNNLQPLLQ